MKDSGLRAIVLKKFYDLRKDGGIWKLTSDDIGEMELSEYERIGAQLGKQGYLEWHNSLDGHNGQGRITSKGVDVVEGNLNPAIAITMHDHSVSVQGSNNVQVGTGNTISHYSDVSRIESAISKMPISNDEKVRTKSLLDQISSNASFASLVGAIATMLGTQAH